MLAAYAALLWLLALRLGWAMAPDELALCGLLVAPLGTGVYDLLLPSAVEIQITHINSYNT